jgi:hypothetical protein
MRRILSFAFAAALVAAGLYIIVMNVLYAHDFYPRGWATGAVLLGVGAVWLWADFVSPALSAFRADSR